ncbi:GGDEF domain-containing protein [Oceanicoccus sp. KOV_DT_Chl]|uniref:GGDEF domain-containing protein n=1 Tax=Oceanicoccus sp. KOV_DT_Chl TaxID=1904639 RepID=UPI000C7D7AB2|nr:GGDEF domain-containing protein [Oceanicoccus sp. KOV_DT_Chl]
MIIADLMTDIVAGVAPEQSLLSAIKLMQEHGCSCVLITEDGAPQGIITERDVVRIFNENITGDQHGDLAVAALQVADVMTREPVCVKQSTSLYDALLLARSRKLRHILVVDDDEKLVGLVTQTDMVNAYVHLIERQVELENLNQQLHLLSNEDALMHIGNRRAMEVELDFTEASAIRYKKYYALALLDVDWFKKYNDHYGHLQGDEALKKLALIIQDNMRDVDRVYRYGGEEILLLMPGSSRADAIVAADRIRHAVEAEKIPHVQSPLSFLTVSVGVAEGSQQSWEEVVSVADTALYRAKEAGRNKVSD